MRCSLPKGLFDIIPHSLATEEEWHLSERWQYVEAILRSCARNYGFREIRTPIFEQTELFNRSVGESSDIVSKEMYTFLDKGNRSMTLRPEGTAPVVRAYIEHNLAHIPVIHKYFYIAPMFRYERPQLGRYRQHHQFGIETFGIPYPEQDVEVMLLLSECYKKIGLNNWSLVINSVGDEESRNAYKEALSHYFLPHLEQLSPESRLRFSRNILRILDSKDLNDQELISAAPSILDFLSQEASDHFLSVQKLLKKEKIPFIINPRLVRGLDYYNKTVFEIISTTSQKDKSLGGGGRFDSLVEQLGGAPTPSFGCATGLERIIQLLGEEKIAIPASLTPLLLFIPMGEEAFSLCFHLTCRLREKGFYVEIDLSKRKISHSLHLAEVEKARYLVVVGDREIDSGIIEIKEMATRTSDKISFDQLESYLRQKL